MQSDTKGAVESRGSGMAALQLRGVAVITVEKLTSSEPVAQAPLSAISDGDMNLEGPAGYHGVSCMPGEQSALSDRSDGLATHKNEMVYGYAVHSSSVERARACGRLCRAPGCARGGIDRDAEIGVLG